MRAFILPSRGDVVEKFTATPRVPGVTPRSGVVIVGVGPPSTSADQRRPFLPGRRRAGATRSRPEVVPFRVYRRTEHLCSFSRSRREHHAIRWATRGAGREGWLPAVRPQSPPYTVNGQLIRSSRSNWLRLMTALVGYRICLVAELNHRVRGFDAGRQERGQEQERAFGRLAVRHHRSDG